MEQYTSCESLFAVTIDKGVVEHLLEPTMYLCLKLYDLHNYENDHC
jgi:hypothetical protein